jgi:ABC-2 type transport system ATP-binding protein
MERDTVHSLQIDGVTKRYGRTTVVQDLTFEVQPGRVTGFLGPNGAGKSTTLKVLLGLASADQGTATIGGTEYARLPDPVRTVGVVLEPNAFHPGRSGRNHLRILADAGGLPYARVDALLEQVGLTEAADRKVGAYSLGMRQRLGIAEALLGDPPVMVLDEPGNGLDPQGIRWLRGLLRDRAAQGHTIFVSSHLLAELENLADDAIVIDRGRLVLSGTIAELQRREVRVRAVSPGVLRATLEQAGATVRMLDDGALVVEGLAIDDVGERAHAAGIALHELSQGAGSLEELFLDLTASGEPADRGKGDVAL